VHSKEKSLKGITLVEVIITAAIVAILATIIIPQFGTLLKTATESTNRGQLAALRSAVIIYYSDNDFFPSNMEVALTEGGKYVPTIPAISIPSVSIQGNPGHSNTSGIKQGDGSDIDDVTNGNIWYFVEAGAGDQDVLVNCIHKDSQGVVWTTY